MKKIFIPIILNFSISISAYASSYAYCYDETHSYSPVIEYICGYNPFWRASEWVPSGAEAGSFTLSGQCLPETQVWGTIDNVVEHCKNSGGATVEYKF